MATVNKASGNLDQNTHNRRRRPRVMMRKKSPKKSDWEIYDEEDPGETVEDIAKKKDVIVTRIGQPYNFTSKALDVLNEVWSTLVARDASTSLVMSRLSLGTAKTARLRLATAKNEHRARKWYVAKSIDEGEGSFRKS